MQEVVNMSLPRADRIASLKVLSFSELSRDRDLAQQTTFWQNLDLPKGLTTPYLSLETHDPGRRSPLLDYTRLAAPESSYCPPTRPYRALLYGAYLSAGQKNP